MEIILTFSGTSRAIKAERVLTDEGVEVRVMPLPAVIRAGCGLCLRISEDELPISLHRLDLSDTAPESVYRRDIIGNESRYECWDARLDERLEENI